MVKKRRKKSSSCCDIPSAVAIFIILVAFFTAIYLIGNWQKRFSEQVAFFGQNDIVLANNAGAADADWKMFRSQFFEMSHPSGWRVKTADDGIRTVVDFVDDKKGSSANEYRVFSVAALPNEKGLTLEQWFQEAKKNGNYEKIGVSSIGKSSAYKIKIPGKAEALRYVFVSGEKRDLIFGVSAYLVPKATVDKILGTFLVLK